MSVTHKIVDAKENTIAYVRMAGKIKAIVNKYTLDKKTWKGGFNGYGYTEFVYTYRLRKQGVDKLLELLKLKDIGDAKPKKERDVFGAWCRRLVKLTGISMEQAEEIAEEKLDYQDDRIAELNERDFSRPSPRRGRLIRKLERENPLRRIVDEGHAYAILTASRRHKETDYEYLLEEGRELALMGEIGKDEVRDYARSHIMGEAS